MREKGAALYSRHAEEARDGPMHRELETFFELVGAIRSKAIVLSPEGLSQLLGVPANQFEYVGEWLLKDAQTGSVSFGLWLRPQKNGAAAHIMLSDVRFELEDCRRVLNASFGPTEYLHSRNGSAGWMTFNETDVQRQSTFIFDGVDGHIYLEMVVVGMSA